MSVQIIRNETPQRLQRAVSEGIITAIGDRPGIWEVDIAAALSAHAWDVEVFGPNNFYWTRRFSGEDRDPEVIREAVRDAVRVQAA